MKNIPSIGAIALKLEDIIAEHVDFERPLNHKAALMAELGFDSLDLIETGFCIQEYFDFEFSDRNALEVLDTSLGGGQVIVTGQLTPLGRRMVHLRMPELADVALPEPCSPAELQRYFSLETFARLVTEFLEAAPDICPETGEPVFLDDFRPRAQNAGTAVAMPGGDSLLDAWVARTVEQLAEQ